MSAPNGVATLTAALTAYLGDMRETAMEIIEGADISELRVMSFTLIGLLEAVAEDALDVKGIADPDDYWAQWLPELAKLGVWMEES